MLAELFLLFWILSGLKFKGTFEPRVVLTMICLQKFRVARVFKRRPEVDFTKHYKILKWRFIFMFWNKQNYIDYGTQAPEWPLNHLFKKHYETQWYIQFCVSSLKHLLLCLVEKHIFTDFHEVQVIHEVVFSKPPTLYHVK